jgi:hypothetical protein
VIDLHHALRPLAPSALQIRLLHLISLGVDLTLAVLPFHALPLQTLLPLQVNVLLGQHHALRPVLFVLPRPLTLRLDLPLALPLRAPVLQIHFPLLATAVTDRHRTVQPVPLVPPRLLSLRLGVDLTLALPLRALALHILLPNLSPDLDLMTIPLQLINLARPLCPVIPALPPHLAFPLVCPPSPLDHPPSPLDLAHLL